MDWKSWFAKAKTKSPYFEQAEELMEIIALHVGMSNIEKVLDVGCGDGRLQGLFGNREYWGLDKEYNEFDLLSEEWIDVPNDFDLGFTSLVLMLFNTEDGKYIFEKMMDRCKYVVLYEENPIDREIGSPNGGEKFCHDYPKWGNVVCWGKSTKNENWSWYVFKGRGK